MSSWRSPEGGSNVTQENGPRAKCDQVVFEAIAKAAEIVVGSRCWIDPPISPGTNTSRFNLMVPEVQGVRYVRTNQSCWESSTLWLCANLI